MDLRQQFFCQRHTDLSFEGLTIPLNLSASLVLVKINLVFPFYFENCTYRVAHLN